ncbi:hypothetical protein TNCV_4328341 [Trichonephila clavipes]|nr:hypothetical protein TNCV_4328341 [Trichonephila clavipes]
MFIVQCRSVILTGKEEKGNFNGKKEGRKIEKDHTKTGKTGMKAKKGILVGFALGTRGYRVWIPEDSRVIETSNFRFQKPQQSNSGAVLASPGLKISRLRSG